MFLQCITSSSLAICYWHDNFQPVCQYQFTIYMYSKGLLFTRQALALLQEHFELNERNQS